MKKLLALSFLVLFMSSCTELTPQQAFERDFEHDFSNKTISSIPINQLLNSPESYPGIGGLSSNFLGLNKDYATLRLTMDATLDYKLDRVWFIYYIDGYLGLNDSKHLAISEISSFKNLTNDNRQYYEFENINHFVRIVVVRLKKDSQTYYLKGEVTFPFEGPS